MSARKQGGQLRSILIRKLRSSGLNEEMVATLQRRKQFYTGTLSQAILKRDLGKNLRISYKINKDLDIIENVVINFTNRVNQPEYAEFVEQTLGQNPQNKINAKPKDIESWIFAKVKNGTWRSTTGDYRVSNNYSTRKEKRDFNKGARGGRSKTYFYPLTGSAKSKKARASLAFLIARSINETQRLKNRSPFVVSQKLNLIAEYAIISGLNEFNSIWLTELTSKSVERVISIF